MFRIPTTFKAAFLSSPLAGLTMIMILFALNLIFNIFGIPSDSWSSMWVPVMGWSVWILWTIYLLRRWGTIWHSIGRALGGQHRAWRERLSQ